MTTKRVDIAIWRLQSSHPRHLQVWSGHGYQVLQTRNLAIEQFREDCSMLVCGRIALHESRSCHKNIKDRMTFCHKYKLWTSDQWEVGTCNFCGRERTFTQFYSFCRHVRRPAKQMYNPKYVIPTVKQAPKIMVWGALSGAGRAGLGYGLCQKTQQLLDMFTWIYWKRNCQILLASKTPVT